MNQPYNPYSQFYPQPYYPQYQQSYTPQPTVQRKVDFVQGRAAAEIFQVNAGEEIILIDMDNPFVYRKARGFDNKLEPMQIFDLIPHVEATEQQPQVSLDGYVKTDQVENMIREEVDRRMSEFTLKPTRRNSKKDEREDDE